MNSNQYPQSNRNSQYTDYPAVSSERVDSDIDASEQLPEQSSALAKVNSTSSETMTQEPVPNEKSNL
ncbi:MAG: hypothetical protein AAF959_14280, partial [Cyanobacteria bacterium P01_D01_bin.56]